MFGITTKPARKHSDINEDVGFAERLDSGVLIGGVFDGMGGHAAGDRASCIALDSIVKRLRSVTGKESQDEMVRMLGETMEGAASEIGRQLPNTFAGTAAVIAVATPEGDGTYRVFIASAADSRAYLQRNNSLELLTVDNINPDDEGRDRLVMDQEEVQRRLNAGRLLKLGVVEREEEMDSTTKTLFYERSLVTNPLMEGEAYRPVITVLSVPSSSRLILTSDGVHDNLTDREIAGLSQGAATSQELAETLVESARNRADDEEHLRHKDDDITAVVITLGKSST